MKTSLLEKVIAKPNAQKAIVMGLSLTVLAVGGILSWLGATAPPQVVAEAVVEQSGDWLMSPTPDLEYSNEQVRLFLLNQDPSRGQQGLLWGQINAEAIRFIGMASLNVQNPKDKCFAKTVVECIELFEVNIQKEYARSTLPSDKARAIIRFYAAELAIQSVMGQKPLVAGEPQSNLLQAVLEKAKVDRGVAKSISPDGVAAKFKQEQIEAEKARKAEEKAQREFLGE